MSSMTATLLTADEYIATGDTRPRRTELINGEVVVNSPTVRHQAIVSFIHFEIMAWVRRGNLRGQSPGQLDVKFGENTVLAPDVLWISEGRMPPDGTHLEIVPDLIVEVRSPSTWRYDTTVKFRHYESAGVPEVWLVDTASNSVLIYRRSSPEVATFDIALELPTGESISTPLLDDFALDIATLFDR